MITIKAIKYPSNNQKYSKKNFGCNHVKLLNFIIKGFKYFNISQTIGFLINLILKYF